MALLPAGKLGSIREVCSSAASSADRAIERTFRQDRPSVRSRRPERFDWIELDSIATPKPTTTQRTPSTCVGRSTSSSAHVGPAQYQRAALPRTHSSIAMISRCPTPDAKERTLLPFLSVPRVGIGSILEKRTGHSPSARTSRRCEAESLHQIFCDSDRHLSLAEIRRPGLCC